MKSAVSSRPPMRRFLPYAWILAAVAIVGATYVLPGVERAMFRDFIDLLRDGSYGELGPRMVGPVERIQASAEHLQSLVDQILDLAKLSAGRLDVHREALSLRAFVIDVASEIEPLVIAKGLTLSIQVPATLPRLATDPMHLRQILVNLLGNAVKFTASGSITVRAAHVPDPARLLTDSPRRDHHRAWTSRSRAPPRRRPVRDTSRAAP